LSAGSPVVSRQLRTQTGTIIFGTAGTGKTKLMEYLIRGDLECRQPICLLDLHGQLYEDIKQWCAYNWYLRAPIFLIDPSEGEYLKGFNPFLPVAGVDSSAQAGDLTDAILAASGDVGAFPRLRKYLNVFLTVCIQHRLPLHTTLLTLLENRPEFTRLVNNVSDPIIRAVWNSAGSITEGKGDLDALVSRISSLTKTPGLRKFLCGSEPSYNLKITFTETILVNLAPVGSLNHESARVIAALFLSILSQNSFRRDLKEAKAHPYFVYVDEFVKAPSPEYAAIPAQNRKFGLFLALANQNIAQIDDAFGVSYRNALLGNYHVRFFLGGASARDLRLTAEEFGVDQEMLNLQERQCLMKLPRQEAQIITLPEVKDYTVLNYRMRQYEKEIAQRVGALPITEIADEQPRPQLKEATGTEPDPFL
jgi:hypothetical protein